MIGSTTRLSFLVASAVFVVPLFAAAPRGTDPANQDLKRVLTGEAEHASASLNRRTELQPALHPKTASDAEWWQAGFVKVGNAWLHAETAHQQLNTSLLQEYRTQREAAPKTAEGQIKLANWCRDHQLGEQEKAHLLQVIILSNSEADRAPIYRRMGYHKVGQHWLSNADLKELQAKQHENDERWREWQQAMERILRNWNANPKQHKQALDELKKIEKPTAIPALLAASTVNEALALAICDQLAKMPSFEASQALAVLAVQSDWTTVRDAATKHLKERKVDDFAPALLGALRTTFQTKEVKNRTTESKLIFREESDKWYVVELKNVPWTIFEGVMTTYTIKMGQISTHLKRASPREVANAIESVRGAADTEHLLQLQMDEENDRAEEYNRRAAAVLSEVSGQEASDDPRYWWTWWQLYTATEPIPKRCEVDTKIVRLPRVVYQDRFTVNASFASCLVSGTPIFTDRGQVAVDQIQVGDRVLAKDVRTGEIGFKSVLRTTERQPVPVTRFVVSGTSITASAGHHFWVSGDGWKKTRELKTGDPIHTATGMARVEIVEPISEPAPVYNLIVEDAHTYFIGSDLILSHDVSQPAPTNTKVPGLDPQ